MKKIFSSVLRTSISLALIVILLYIMRDRYGEIISTLKGANISMLMFALSVFFLALCVASFRFELIVKAQENISITFFEAVSLTFIGYFFNNFLPTSIGGDVVKAYHLSKKAKEKTGSFTAVFVDRAIGLLTMIFMAFIALFFVETKSIDTRVKYMIYSITAASFLFMLFMMNRAIARRFSIFLLFLRPIEEKLRKLYTAINRYRHHKILMFHSLLISVASQLLFFLSIGIIASSIGSHISVMQILLRMPIISVMSLLPSINGLGLREGSTVLLFGPLIGKENAFAISILWFLVLFVISLLGGLVYALSPQFKVKLKEIEV